MRSEGRGAAFDSRAQLIERMYLLLARMIFDPEDVAAGFPNEGASPLARDHDAVAPQARNRLTNGASPRIVVNGKRAFRGQAVT